MTNTVFERLNGDNGTVTTTLLRHDSFEGDAAAAGLHAPSGEISRRLLVSGFQQCRPAVVTGAGVQPRNRDTHRRDLRHNPSGDFDVSTVLRAAQEWTGQEAKRWCSTWLPKRNVHQYCLLKKM